MKRRPADRKRSFLLALVAGAIASTATAQSATGTTVQDELKQAQRAGIEIIYSTDLVPANLAAAPPAPDATPLQRAVEALASNGLSLRAIGVGKFVVVKAEKPAVSGAATAPEEILDEVSVYASRYSIHARQTSDGQVLSQTDLQTVPGTHDDPMRAVRSLPGVATAASARPYIRGSLADDVLVQYDGITLLDPFHLKNFQNLFGAIDPLAVGGVEVYSGGYPVRYGTRSGGVIDISPRTSEQGQELDLTASQIAAGIAFSGTSDSLPIDWLATIRRNTTNLLLQPIEAEDGEPRVLDASGRLRWHVNDGSALTLGWLLLDDHVRFGDDTSQEFAHARYRDEYVWLASTNQLSTHWRSRTTLALAAATRTRDGDVAWPGIATGDIAEDRSYNKTELTSEWNYEPDPDLTATIGGALANTHAEFNYARQLALDPGIAAAFDRPPSDDLAGSGAPKAWTYSTYASLRRRWPTLETELGMRMDGQDYGSGGTRLQWSPRLNIRYDLLPSWHAYGSIGRFTQAQGVEQWRAEELQDRADPVQVAIHTVVGLSHDSDGGTHWSVELYRKHWSRVSPYFESELDPSALLPDLHPDRIRIAPEDSEARGAEFSMRTRINDEWQGWTSITFSKVEDDFAGADAVRSWDQPFAVNGGLAWTRSSLSFSGMVDWHSGWARTPVHAGDASSGATLFVDARNSGRWNDYVSLDLKGSWMRPMFGGDLSLFTELTNTTDRLNACCSVLRSPAAGDPDLSVGRKHWLPFIANLGLTYRWRSGY